MSSRELSVSNTVEKLPFNLTQLLAFAMQKPRDPIGAMDNAIAQLRAAPQFAAKAFYAIPFKKKDGTTEWVKGPSIKAATALTGCWGNNIEGGFISEENEDYVDVSGFFFDYETGKLTMRPYRVSKTYRTQEGKVVPWRKDMFDKQLAAGISKAIRNADLNGLPAGFVAQYYSEAMAIAARGGKTDVPKNSAMDVENITKQIGECIKTFEGLGVPGDEVASYISRHRELENEEMVAAHLIGILNAIEEGQTTIDEVFSVSQEAPITTPQPTAAETVAPKAATPPASAPAPEKIVILSKFDGAKCSKCGLKMAKGTKIYKNAEGKYVHEAC